MKLELHDTQTKLAAALKATEQAQDCAADFKARFEAAQQELKAVKAELQRCGVESGDLKVETALKARELEKLNCVTLGFQGEIDRLTKETRDQSQLIAKLTEELRRAEKLKERTEEDRDVWVEKFNKSVHDLEVLQRAKDHSDRHVAILVKEKDRIITKKPEPSAVLSSKHSYYEATENSFVTDRPESSWSDVEILRLKQQLKDLTSSLSVSKQESERLKKENWNLLNRLRNVRTK
jgi:chromosome segregation ATPase